MSDEVGKWQKMAPDLDGADLTTAVEQALEEGRDLEALQPEIQRFSYKPRPHSPQWRAAVLGLLDQVENAPALRDMSAEPDEWSDIQAAPRKIAKDLPEWHGEADELKERLHGGFAGRIAGCALGKPVEGWSRNEMQMTGEVTDNWPLHDFWREPTDDQKKQLAERGVERPFEGPAGGCLSGLIEGMVEDDDINYTLIGLLALERGRDFSSLDVAKLWLSQLPILRTYTAERVAIRNLVYGMVPPQSAQYRNPYREWIGAQIRADAFGYASPGKPEQAAEYAWRDARLSHVKNGIYGEMWVAAMIAAAFVVPNEGTNQELTWIIRTGLAQIPVYSRLYKAIDRVIVRKDQGVSYSEAMEDLHLRWDEKKGHHWCHTISNAEIVAIGLLYGDNDFEQTISRAVMPGFDTDCNGATCGSILGVRLGFENLPKKWTEPFQDGGRSGLADLTEYTISGIAERFSKI
ncbi:MAG: ADP-ribosylglycohydrolase family protein [Fimbriimonadaceae bacterium]